MKTKTLLIFFIVFAQCTFGQTTKKIADEVSFYKVDRIGNVYFVDAKNNLTKYEPNVPRYTRFADLRSGKITSIDVSNPLRVVVFYADQAVVKFLDVNLTEINSFQIRSTYPEGWISLVASSNNNGLWMYDNLNRKLLKLGEQLNTLFVSSDLYLVLSKKINPTEIIEYADQLYLCDSTQGVFVFDLFGGYKKTLAFYPSKILQIDKDKILFEKNSTWLSYSDFKTDTLSTTTKSASQTIIWDKKTTYFLENNTLYQKSE